jgi:hypothetical protein
MKKVLVVGFISSMIVFGGSLEVLSIEEIKPTELKSGMLVAKSNTESIKYKKMKIKDTGIEKTIKIVAQLSTFNKLTAKEGVLVDFSAKQISLEAFEKEFNLKFIKKLQIGYYIFENQSTWSDFELIDKILESDSVLSIRTIRPNWKMDVKPI